MQIITLSIQKGGTGKTTTAAALTQAAAFKKKRALAVDLDPQGNLSFALGAAAAEKKSSYDILHGLDAESAIQHITPYIDVIPASCNLAAEETSKGSATRLKKALDPIKRNYDFIFIDTPPTAGEMQYNALFASTGLLIPLQADIYNLQSLYQITETAKQIQQTNGKLEILGFIIAKQDNRSTLARQMQENIIIAANKQKIPYLGSIRTGIAVQEAAALQKSLFEYAPKSKPAQDYLSLLETLNKNKSK